jgi:MraZ protein
MFIGQYIHHLEEKGRISIPKKFRASLDSGAIVSQGLDGCLFLYPKTAWETLIDKISRLPLTRSDARNFIRNLSFSATEVEIDRLGRILIPDYLRSFAILKTDCIIAGAIDRIEIWDSHRFAEYTAHINSQAEAIAEKLAAEGI